MEQIRNIYIMIALALFTVMHIGSCVHIYKIDRDAARQRRGLSERQRRINEPDWRVNYLKNNYVLRREKSIN